MAAGALMLVAVNGAHAAEPAAEPPRLIASDGGCPAAETITAAITSLLPRGGVSALPPSTRVEVVDLGESYRVRLLADGKERVRAYRDAYRDCDQRARFVAVFIVLTLMPPELLAESPVVESPPAPTPAPAAVVVVPPAPPPPPTGRFRLDVSAILDFAPAIGDAPAVASPGAELRFSAARRRFELTAGLGVQPSSSFSVGGLEGRQLRLPLDVGVGARVPAGPLEVELQAGLAAALFHASSVNLAVAGGGTRLDRGARAAVAVRLGRSSAHLAPALGVHALYFVRPYEIGATPAGVLGHMPSLWLGATAGASLSF